MAFIHGKGAATLVGAFDLSAFLNNFDVAATSDTAEVTTFGRDFKAYIPGLADATVSMAGFFDGADGAVDPVLSAALGTAQLITLVPGGAGTIGNRGYLGTAIKTSYSIASPVGDAVSISAEAQVTGGLRPAVVLANLVARTAAGQTASLDNAASTSGGALAILHLVAFTGTDVDIKIQESADNSTWVDLVAFTQATGTTAEIKAVTGTVARYLRVDVAGTFTTATFAVSFARL